MQIAFGPLKPHSQLFCMVPFVYPANGTLVVKHIFTFLKCVLRLPEAVEHSA